ncbi:hypothetical protein APT62_03060 [Aerococcus urinaeequi]|uniref:O-antigen ligase family protein n=1 Tax=Aerococcus urinaeequi TaxID=51665 RepID=UPI000744BBFD|nr:O-antigen ligase family protein [Aerococcus urinaeequi]ALZ87496.1 hypothetical protein APT62_03060 [Aerococcus urinaeequi]
MRISWFGAMLTIATIINIVKYDRRKALAMNFTILLAIYIFIGVGYHSVVFGVEFANEEFVTLILAIQSLLVIFSDKSKFSTKTILSLLLFLLSISIGLALLKIAPYDQPIFTNEITTYEYYFNTRHSYASFGSQSLRFFIRIFLFLIISLGLKQVLNKYTQKSIIYVIDKVFIINIGLIFIELLSKLLLSANILNNIIGPIFGRVGLQEIFRGGSVTIIGLHTEPYHLVLGLWMYSIIILFSDMNKNDTSKRLLVVIASFIISTSLAGIILCFILIVLYLYKYASFNTFIKFSLFASTIILCFVIFNDNIDLTYYSNRLTNMFSAIGFSSVEAQKSGSESLRFYLLKDAIFHFSQRPIFGIGLGTVFTFSAVPMILSNIGITGLLFYSLFQKSLWKNSTRKVNYIPLFLIVSVYFFVDTIAILYSPGLIFFIYIYFINQQTELIKGR